MLKHFTEKNLRGRISETCSPLFRHPLHVRRSAPACGVGHPCLTWRARIPAARISPGFDCIRPDACGPTGCALLGQALVIRGKPGGNPHAQMVEAVPGASACIWLCTALKNRCPARIKRSHCPFARLSFPSTRKAGWKPALRRRRCRRQETAGCKIVSPVPRLCVCVKPGPNSTQRRQVVRRKGTGKPNSFHRSCIAGYPGGMTAISRGLRKARAPPPEPTHSIQDPGGIAARLSASLLLPQSQ
jgi:hypothetical protein